MDILFTIASFILIIMLLVFVHEMGHFLMARYFGVYVEKFSVGFGKSLVSWKDKHGTTWQISPIPLGGYVKMYGEFHATHQAKMPKISAALKARAFVFKPLYQRALIVFAGPLANFIFAAFCFAGIYFFQGQQVSLPVISQVVENGPAAKAGLEAGDVIKKVNGESVESFQEVQEIVFYAPNQEITIDFERQGQALVTIAKAGMKTVKDALDTTHEIGFLGVQGNAAIHQKLGLVQSLTKGTRDVGDLSVQMLKGVRDIITGKQSSDDVGSVLRIADMSSKVAKIGVVATVWFIGILSINLGLINLFPIPVLDGGHLMFYLYEAIMRRPASAKVHMIASKIGLFLLLGLMIFAISNDVVFFISK